mmetsp:Transcript_23767/g.49529  ORF Transcript_23767/g.49529 Transcript_23767/m.49529 type:complete len:241 (-) Transcript_23767:46-768(-)
MVLAFYGIIVLLLLPPHSHQYVPRLLPSTKSRVVASNNHNPTLPSRPCCVRLYTSTDGEESDDKLSPSVTSSDGIVESGSNAEEEALKSFKNLIKDNGGVVGKENGKETFTYTPPNTPPPLPSSLKSLTKPGPPSSNELSLPLLGTIPVDGNLLLIIPAGVIGVLGLLTSLYIGLTSSDDISKALKEADLGLAPNVKNAGGRVKVKKDGKECRGLCYSQEEDLRNKQDRIEKYGSMSIFF